MTVVMALVPYAVVPRLLLTLCHQIPSVCNLALNIAILHYYLLFLVLSLLLKCTD